MQTQRGLRLIETDVRLARLGTHLPERRQVVQQPKRASVCRDHQIIIFNHQIVNWCYRQIQLQWLPMRAVVERNKNADLGSRVK